MCVNYMSSVYLNRQTFCKNWFYNVTCKLKEHDLSNCVNINVPVSKSYLCVTLENCMMDRYVLDWQHVLNNHTGTAGRGGNKLRTYSLFKSCFAVEQ